MHFLARSLHSELHTGRYTSLLDNTEIRAGGKATFHSTSLPRPIIAQMMFILRESVMCSLQYANWFLSRILACGSAASVNDEQEVLAHRQAWLVLVLQGTFAIKREVWNTSRFNMDEEHDHVLLYLSFHQAGLVTGRVMSDIMTKVMDVYLEYQSLATGINHFCPKRVCELLDALIEIFRVAIHSGGENISGIPNKCCK